MTVTEQIAANTFGWLAVHLLVAYAAVRAPAAWFRPGDIRCSTKAWESRAYQLLGIRRWKHLLPDGATWLGSRFSKKRLMSHDAGYLLEFLTETRRAEVAHWIVLGATVLFLPWNQRWAWPLLWAYSIAANLPCIVVQRYNRKKLCALLEHPKQASYLFHANMALAEDRLTGGSR